MITFGPSYTKYPGTHRTDTAVSLPIVQLIHRDDVAVLLVRINAVRGRHVPRQKQPEVHGIRTDIQIRSSLISADTSVIFVKTRTKMMDLSSTRTRTIQ